MPPLPAGWQLYGYTFSAMSCANELQLAVPTAALAQAEALARQVEAEVRRLEALWSRYRPDSMVSRINQAKGASVAVDAETAGLLDYAAAAWQSSGGQFDLTSGVLRRVWRFEPGSEPPSAEAIAALLPLIGWEKVDWQSPLLRLPAGMEIDLGGLGKEYAADRAATLIAAAGLSGLINLGGDMVATGPLPGADGSEQPWQIGIAAAGGASALAARVPLSRGALASSGDYERCLIHQGRRYGHILDPHTGWPVPDGPSAVSVLAPTCLLAGTLATLALLQGPTAADWLAANGVQHWLQWPTEPT